jgi:dipeptidase E
MNGKLFLSGGGGAKDSLPVDTLFVESLKKSAKVLYIPHANRKQAGDYSGSISWVTETLNVIDQKKQLVIECIGDLRSVDELNGYDAVYIGGGNTYFLLDLLKDCGLAEKLVDYYNRGGHIYGGSAGAIILGKTIATSPDDLIGVNKDFDGLNLLGGMSIACHYEKGLVDRLNVLKGQHILCLYENSAAYKIGHVLKSVGERDFAIELY